jgi:hypothetical protein
MVANLCAVDCLLQHFGMHCPASCCCGQPFPFPPCLPPRLPCPPPAQVPDLDSRALAELMEMGFPEALCRNALLWGRNQFEPALEWVLGHAEDPAATDPLRWGRGGACWRQRHCRRAGGRTPSG